MSGNNPEICETCPMTDCLTRKASKKSFVALHRERLKKSFKTLVEG